jgi:hypothetical protein
MRHFQLAASVQAACYEIIERMIEGSVFNKDRLRLAGVCPALASSLLQILDEKETLVAGLDCMLLLMTENMQNVIAMGNAGAHSLLVTAMATHADDIEVQSLGCICIQHLGRHGPTSLALGKVGVCARVTHAFKFVEQLSVILHQTVATLCMQPSNIVEFGNAGLCEVLVRLMHDKPEAATLQVWSWMRVFWASCCTNSHMCVFCVYDSGLVAADDPAAGPRRNKPEEAAHRGRLRQPNYRSLAVRRNVLRVDVFCGARE